jgi:hypothetical protein
MIRTSTQKMHSDHNGKLGIASNAPIAPRPAPKIEDAAISWITPTMRMTQVLKPLVIDEETGTVDRGDALDGIEHPRDQEHNACEVEAASPLSRPRS